MLTQQFLITLTLPLVFLLLARYGRQASSKPSGRAWAAALVAAAFWAGSILSFYTGGDFPQEIGVAWRMAGRYALSLSALLVLLATTRQLHAPPASSRLGLAIAAVLGIAALMLEPVLVNWGLDSLQRSDIELSPFALWSAVWAASWIVPLLGSWLLTWQLARQTPRSLFRNRLNYWQVTLIIYGLAGVVALVQQPKQPVWQDIGALGLIGAAILGNTTLRRSDLPELKPALRNLAARLASTLLIFALAWIALWLMGRLLPQRSGVTTGLDLILFAGIFAALIAIADHFVTRSARWLVLPRRPQPPLALSPGADLAQSLAEPAELAGLSLRLVQATLGADRAQLFSAEAGPGGGLMLAPLATLPDALHSPPVVLAGSSPLTAYLQSAMRGPLSTYDLAQGELFSGVPAAEKEAIAAWQSRLLLALHVGQQLVGLLALGDKATGAAYDDLERDWLQTIAFQLGPLLWQAGQIEILDQLNRQTFGRLDRLTLEQQFLEELSTLHQQFMTLVSADLYAPFGEINSAIQQLKPVEEQADMLSRPLAELRTMIGHLVNVAGRVEHQREFSFTPMYLNDAVQQAARNLAPMASARRVQIQIDHDPRLPRITGDEERLAEAIQHLLHNAIKFNKIGGEVWLDCGMAGNELYLHIRDTGVGIPPERSEQIWHTISYWRNGRYRSSDGVGLLLARFIVRAHGGRVEMASRYGEGTTFSIYLPLALET